jgi:uncharacterized membrane protein
MGAIGALGGGILMLLVVAFLVVLAVLGILMPFFVFRIRNEMIQLNEQVAVALRLLKGQSDQPEEQLPEPTTNLLCEKCGKSEAYNDVYNKVYCPNCKQYVSDSK